LTNLCLDQPDGYQPTGKTFWWNREDDVAEATSSIGGAVTVGRHAPGSFGHSVVNTA